MRVIAFALLLIACGPDRRHGGPNGGDDDASVTCTPDCPADQVCSNGTCKTPCEAAADNPSNLGCDFWAVDLKNDVSTIGGITTDAMVQQFSIVVANNNTYPVQVNVTKNAGRVGAPLSEQPVVSAMVMPGVAQRIDLPQREIDGSMGQNAGYVQRSGSGTFVSPHAYHVLTNGPVVVYQFNPIIQAYTNDASTLIPVTAIGMDYVVLGYPTANPCDIANLHMVGIPDHTSVTVVATQDDTTVTVTATHPIEASGGDSGIAIGKTPKGTPLTLHLSRYDVANLSSDQPMNVSILDCDSMIKAGQNGDFTGTHIHSDKPVVAFTSGDRAEGFGGAKNIVFSPQWDSMMDDTCCTDHVEEQLFPTTALGQQFAIARSPIRSTDPDNWVEPDIVRVLATVDNTTITTNLDAPYDHFSLNARQQMTFGATTGFTLVADKAVEVNSFLVSQDFVKPGQIGDPSQITLPAAEQFRKDYVFLVPSTFQLNYMALAVPTAAHVVLDGMALDGVEFSNCTKGPIGMLNGTDYQELVCKLSDGQHMVSADQPFGLSVYGYYTVGSYAFVGGSDVKLINPIE